MKATIMKKRTLKYAEYYDKVLGGWIGKCAGGILGAPIEGYKCFNDIEISDELFATNFPNDDLDLQVLWLDMVKKKGPKVDEYDLREHWMRHVQFPWGEYGIASRNLKLGLDIPDAGQHNNHYWYRGMGSPIRSEIWGMLNPGDPKSAMKYARMDSELDHHGFSVEAEMFLSAAASIAFFENDIILVLNEALALFPDDSEIKVLVRTVQQWHDQFDKAVVAGKIKSRYGDADFTSAPQNIAFTILALLESSNSMDGIMEALHYGHDSDCVVATAGALLGIINSYERIPESWKRRVGNELLVSPEIVGLKHSDTITGLAEETCRAGLSFVVLYNEIVLEAPEGEPYPVAIDDLSIKTRITKYPIAGNWKEGQIEVEITNRSGNKRFVGELSFQSPCFESREVQCEIEGSSSSTAKIELKWKKRETQFAGQACFDYEIAFRSRDGQTVSIERGIPNYGSWKLIGPFITDDKDLVPMHEEYPDHGLDSLPSFNYMNRDRLNVDKDFISTSEIKEMIQLGSLEQQAFDVQTIYPDGFRIDLSKYYIGRGERTVYLFSTIESDADQTKWLTMGCTAYFSCFLEDELLYKSDEIIRSWPYAHFFKFPLKRGTNHLLIRIDTPTDYFDFEIGLKEFSGKHPHQSMWETKMIFNAE